MHRLLVRRVALALVLVLGFCLASPGAQGQFWVLVNGALNYTGPVTINGSLTVNAAGLSLLDPTSTTALFEGVKVVTAIPDATLTTILTLTVPNAAEAAEIWIEVVSSLGAGGAIGAFEASQASFWTCAVTRVAGVNSVVGCTSITNGTGAIVAGGNGITNARSFTAAAGGVSVVNTHTLQLSITRTAGSSTNHQAVVHYRLLNNQAGGVTIS